MQSDFAELAVCRLKAGSANIHGIQSITNQHAFVTAKIAKLKEAAPSHNGSIHKEPGEIVEPDDLVKDKDKHSDLEGLMARAKVEASRLEGKLCPRQEKCHSEHLVVLANMLAIIALAEQGLDSEHQATSRELELVQVESELQIASRTAMLAHHSALAKTEEARKCRVKVKDAEE